mmetsp:Transcript_28589/g.88644  ORF Transcript_28589/g.88644 Transcript_28589/m.88644 type:complete len:246 (+) Transcript_28589:833-1570(+)
MVRRRSCLFVPKDSPPSSTFRNKSPRRRGVRYSALASATWSRPSRVVARRAKISSTTAVLSRTRTRGGSAAASRRRRRSAAFSAARAAALESGASRSSRSACVAAWRSMAFFFLSTRRSRGNKSSRLATWSRRSSVFCCSGDSSSSKSTAISFSPSSARSRTASCNKSRPSASTNVAGSGCRRRRRSGGALTTRRPAPVARSRSSRSDDSKLRPTSGARPTSTPASSVVAPVPKIASDSSSSSSA